MEDVNKTYLHVSTISSKAPLFPCAASSHNDDNGHASLFPAAEAISNKQSPSKCLNENLDWLSNKSYTSGTAKKLAEFQEELNRELKKYESDCDDKNSRILVPDDDDKPAKTEVNTFSTDTDTYERDKHLRKTKWCKDSSIKDTDSGGENLNVKKRKKKRSRSYSDPSDDDKHHKSIHVSDGDLSDDNRKKMKKKKSKKKKKKQEREKEKHWTESKYVNLEQAFKNKVFLDDVDIPVKDAFHIDRAADVGSWNYGSLYTGSIAQYRPLIQSYLGRGRNQPIHCKKKVDNKKREKADRYFGKENRKLSKQVTSILLLSKTEQGNDIGTVGLDSNDVFVPIEQNKDTVIENVREQMLDKSTSMYIQGKYPERQEKEKSLDQTVNPLRLKIADYNKRLREDPLDVQLWLEFVKFQDSALLADENMSISEVDNEENTKQGTNSYRGVIDKKLSILDKALAVNPGNINLLVAKLELNAELMEASQINKEMEQLLFVHPANTDLWRQYLMYNQSSLSVFTVSKVSKHYHKCFETLTRLLDGNLHTTHSIPEDLEKELLDMFLLYCYMLKQTSHKERVLATIQAMLEFNFFCPQSLNSVSKETKMAAFEEFWESNCTKIGMVGAVGWDKWSENKSASQSGHTEKHLQAKLEELEEDVIETKGSRSRIWLTLEGLRDMHHWFPWQADTLAGETEDDCEDVERLVLFDDVAPAVFGLSEKYRFSLIVGAVAVLIGNMSDDSDLEGPSSIYCESLEQIMIPNSSKPGSLNNSLLSGVISEELTAFVINILESTIPHFSGLERTRLILMLIQIQLSKYKQRKELGKKEKKEMRAIVKNVLREEENRNNLSVWIFYINLERQIGKPGEALAITETALTMHSGKSVDDMSPSVVDLIRLFGLYGEIDLNMKKYLLLSPRMTPVSSETRKKVAYALSCLVNEEPVKFESCKEVSGSSILRATSKFSKIIKQLVKQANDGQCDRTIVLTKLEQLLWCLSLFQYCTTNFQSCQSTFTRYSSILETGLPARDFSRLEKALLTQQLHLILHHMTTASASLQILRKCLDQALDKYPSNPGFLGLFVDVERKSRITGRLNRCFDKWCRWSGSPVPVVFAVLTQLEFLREIQALVDSDAGDVGLSSSGVVHRTRCWLEVCLSRPKLRHCSLLWKLYLQFETHAGNTSRQKGVFYRAIQECPWVKSLYVQGVEMFGEGQLQEIVDLMTEKEIRVQLPLEELDILIG